MLVNADKILPLALYPLIATQGLYVKYRAARLSEPPGARAGVTGIGDDLRVLIVGDSSAASVGADHQSDGLAGQFVRRLAATHRVDWQLVAHCGDTTARSLARLAALPDQHFDVVLTGLGVNDAKNGKTLAAWTTQTDALHAMCVDRFGARVVVASGMPPVADFPLLPDPLRAVLAARCAQFDAALRDVVDRRPACHYLPGDLRLTPQLMAVDGFHPTAQVYEAWAQRAADVVAAAL